MNSEPLLSICDLSARYGAHEVLAGVNITVHKGEKVTVIGANGAGKTTLLHCLAGLVLPTAGTITLRGEEITNLPAHERVTRHMALVPEGRKIFPRLTVKENLELGAFTQPDRARVKADLQNAIDLFPVLGQRLSQTGGTLSGGEQQMLAIGRALMSHPQLLLLDEPSMGVAPIMTDRIFSTLEALSAQGVTILLVEQNAQLALQFAGRAYVLETGSVTLEGKAHDLMNNEEVKKAYLGA